MVSAFYKFLKMEQTALAPTYTFQNPHPQSDGLFETLPLPILRYIFKTANSEQWKKLHKTCKFLFSRYPYILADILDIQDWYCSFAKSHTYHDTKYSLQYDKKKFGQIQNIWLSKTFRFNSSKIPMSSIIPKICRCEIKNLTLSKCTMSESDLKFLTKWEKVESFHLSKVTVFNSENIQLPFEDVVAYAPYASVIQIETSFTTDETSMKLTELKRTQKFKKFTVAELEGTLDHELIYEFLKKNAGINSHFSVEFFDDEENTQLFKELLNHELSKLNWCSILENTSTFCEYDRIYDKFGVFWNKVQNQEMLGSGECGCLNGDQCTSPYLYKVKSLPIKFVRNASIQLSYDDGMELIVESVEEESSKKPSKKKRVWYFLVKKGRSIRNLFQNPFLI